MTAGRVVVRLPAVLAEHADGQRAIDVAVPAGGGTVGQVLDALTASRPRLAWSIRDETGALRRHVNVFVGDEDIRVTGGQDTPVAEGDVVTLLPSVAGG